MMEQLETPSGTHHCAMQSDDVLFEGRFFFSIHLQGAAVISGILLFNFKILKEPLLVQKQTLHQQKALNFSYLEPKGQGQGIIMRS